MISKLVGLVALVLLVMVVKTFHTQASTHQKDFLAGKAPNPLPTGFYPGSADFPVFTWKGKRFDGASMTGVNVFNKDGKDTEKYPFTLSTGKGLRDANLDVMKIEYDIPANPFWLRPVLDEVVEVAPGKFLGKIHYRLIPGFPFSIGYFMQQKGE